MKVYMMRVSEDGKPYRGYVGEIENTLEAKQAYVGGLIQVIRLDEKIDAIINDEGKLIPLQWNRLWFVDGKEPIDIIMGNILCCRHDDEGNFTDIQEEDIPVILSHLKVMFFDIEVPNEMLEEYDGSGDK